MVTPFFSVPCQLPCQHAIKSDFVFFLIQIKSNKLIKNQKNSRKIPKNKKIYNFKLIQIFFIRSEIKLSIILKSESYLIKIREIFISKIFSFILEFKT